MSLLRAIFSPRLRLLAQEREIAALRSDNTRLRAQVDSMQAGMRRCVDCDYRIAFKAAQHGSAGGIAPERGTAPAGEYRVPGGCAVAPTPTGAG